MIAGETKEYGNDIILGESASDWNAMPSGGVVEANAFCMLPGIRKSRIERGSGKPKSANPKSADQECGIGWRSCSGIWECIGEYNAECRAV